MWYIWIIAIIIAALGIGLIISATSKDEDVSVMMFFGTIFTSLGMILILGLCGLFDSEPKPQPIDVYRGKTTLEITYRDTIPVDTVVVWKDEFKPVD